MSAFHLCLRNEKYHKDKIITMRYRKASQTLGLFDSKEVKVDSSLRAPFKEVLNVLKSRSELPPEVERGIKEGENLVSEIGITLTPSNVSLQNLTPSNLNAPEKVQIKVHFMEGYKKEPLVVSIQSCRVFFEALSRELGFKPALGEQHLKDLPLPHFFEKVHRMIAIHALGVTPNKTANL